MQITSVEIHFIHPQRGLIGFATIALNESLILSGIGIHERADGLGHRLTYPTKLAGSHDLTIFRPLTPALSKAIEVAIFSKLSDLTKSSNDRHSRTYPPLLTV